MSDGQPTLVRFRRQCPAFNSLGVHINTVITHIPTTWQLYATHVAEHQTRKVVLHQQ